MTARDEKWKDEEDVLVAAVLEGLGRRVVRETFVEL